MTEQVRLLAKDEDENPTEPSAYDVIRPYDQAKALGKSNIDVGRIAAGLPCGSEGLLLMCPVAKTRKGTLQRKKRVSVNACQVFILIFCISFLWH